MLQNYFKIKVTVGLVYFLKIHKGGCLKKACKNYYKAGRGRIKMADKTKKIEFDKISLTAQEQNLIFEVLGEAITNAALTGNFKGRLSIDFSCTETGSEQMMFVGFLMEAVLSSLENSIPIPNGFQVGLVVEA